MSLEGVTEETIADALKQLLEKGENTSGPIFLDMGPKIIECCTFLVRCCQRLVQHSASHSIEHNGTSPVVEIYKNALTTFFTKRQVSGRSTSTMKTQQIDCLSVTEIAMWSSLQCMCRFTVMCRLMTGIHSEKCVIRQFHCCVNVIECTYTNLDSIAYYTPRLHGLTCSS